MSRRTVIEFPKWNTSLVASHSQYYGLRSFQRCYKIGIPK